MSSHLELKGTIIEAAHSVFKVKIDSEDSAEEQIINCTLSGKLRKNRINVLVGDRVLVKVSPYDLGRGFVCFRLKS